VRTSANIREELERFVDRLNRRSEQLERVSKSFSQIRLIIVLGGAGFVYFAHQTFGSTISWLVFAAFATGFGVVAFFHNRIIGSIRKHRVYSGIKQTHIARIGRDWDRLRETPFREAPSAHAFARDLDLTGIHSLHRLLDTSFTIEGSARLREWLLISSVDPASSRDRQQLVRELIPLTRFRDRLSLLSDLVNGKSDDRWEGDVLLRWLNRHVDPTRMRVVLFVLVGLSGLTALLLVLNLLGLLGTLWLLSFVLYAGVYLLNFRLYSHLFDEAEHLYSQLNRFRPVLIFLENHRFESGSRLRDVCAPFQEASKPASSYLRTIMWLSVAASAQKNDLLRIVLNVIMPWDLLFTFQLHRYKERLRERLPIWLDAVRTLEAANSLATFASLHPEYSFPSIGDEADESRYFYAKGLGHPLLAEDGKVRNDLRIDAVGHITLVTGSNMSGKSTFIRTLGTNLALTFAGGPVDAEAFYTIPFRLFTCMNVSDSVTDGISYFYAEVKRLKRLLDELQGEHEFPLFFLVDEIFRGTNNRERLIGSRALLLSLTNGNGAGVVSTHDLELIKLETESPDIQNHHFRETVEKGRMVFDYRLRPGPCPTTNALTIMQMEGLPIDSPTRNEQSSQSNH